ncbi:MAG: 2-amino-4-hydroxy-6-hydroxymethyldihydropteridine diphosphokinase [Candidatus Nitronauta litoralis]|uniref:2-amino-4-hydroxy-6-hydroxymethyldihydropteridine pyrophosphokinase n=1 Tax=Candidatus Nitronauta litoralis TaxID=2705533 RepID=A0A7T0BY28_9BACT|nr:MAG: 2-amino-4-hydroxy-6-hydroxymethyldihydropteridine diphosphokinase [Candidatus Nitronauta litoralis]
MPETIFIGLGSNLKQPAHNLYTAFVALSKIEGMYSPLLSPLYKTSPFGVQDQPDFINAIAQFQTTLEPRTVLNALLDIEIKMGRVRKEKWGPRLIDLDLLFFGDQTIDEDGLKVPHPGIAERDFVLIPMMDIAPDWIHPTYAKSISELVTQLDGTSTINRIESDR